MQVIDSDAVETPLTKLIDAHGAALARIAALERTLAELWDVAVTVDVDGKRGCFVTEADWRRLVVDVVHGE